MKLHLAFGIAACLACSAESPPPAARGTLPPGILATVGSEAINSATVVRIAAAEGVSANTARERAIRDALLAAAVRADPPRLVGVGVAERATLGRLLLESLLLAVKREGPPRDAEVDELTSERWTELDRPVSVRVTHAVILAKKPDQDEPARAAAVRLAEAVLGAATAVEFRRRLSGFSVAPLELRVEPLSPITSDGRMWDPSARGAQQTSSVDPVFTRAAHALAAPGVQSPVVKTSFGYHVILLEERLPEVRSSLEERRDRLADDVYARRAKRSLEALLVGLRQKTPIAVERSADDLTALVPVAP